jgi:membrane protein DedA with SNARE-associated domain
MEGHFAELALWLSSFDALTIYGIGFAVIVVCGLGLPIPEDITLLTMGYMTYLPMPDGTARPHASVVLAVIAGYAGVMIGDGIMFHLGAHYGLRLAGRRPFCWVITEQRVESARQFLVRHGPKVLFSARFMPGIRSVVFFTSGALGTPYRRFVIYDGLAALLSVPFFVVAGWYWGEDIHWVIERARTVEHGVLFAIIGVAVFMAAKALWARRAADRSRRSAEFEVPNTLAE